LLPVLAGAQVALIDPGLDAAQGEFVDQGQYGGAILARIKHEDHSSARWLSSFPHIAWRRPWSSAPKINQLPRCRPERWAASLASDSQRLLARSWPRKRLAVS